MTDPTEQELTDLRKIARDYVTLTEENAKLRNKNARLVQILGQTLNDISAMQYRTRSAITAYQQAVKVGVTCKNTPPD